MKLTNYFFFEGSVRFFLQKYWSELCGIRQQKNGCNSKGMPLANESSCIGKHITAEGEHAKWEQSEEGWMKVNVGSNVPGAPDLLSTM